MNIEITDHAKERMQRYDVSEALVLETLENPTNVTEGYGNRKVYQKKLNGYVLRIIVEESKGIKRVITIYKARSERYGI